MNKRIIILIYLIATFISSCEKSYENFSPTHNEVHDTAWTTAVSGNYTDVNALHQNLIRLPLTDSFSLNNNSVIEFPDNIRIEMPVNSFLQNGNSVTGNAMIEFSLLKTKGDFIRFRKPTTSNGYLLESGGALNISVSKNGQPLTIATGKQIKISYRNTIVNDSMKSFTANTTVTGNGITNFNWVPDTTITLRTTQNGYEVVTNKLNWIGNHYFKDTAALKTRIALILPNSFTNANTSAFIVFKNIKGVLQMDADASNRIWRKEKVGVNKPVIYVTISKKGSDYYLGSKETVTSTNQNIELKPEKKSLQDIKNFLDGL